MLNYSKAIWKIRFFIFHLVFADIRLRYRRSFLGLSWAVLQPLSLALLLALVFGTVFKMPIATFLPFVFSGIVIWEFIASSISQGCTTYIQASTYIKQFHHPLFIYTIRNLFANSINLLLAFSALLAVVLFFNHSNFNLSWLTLPFAFSLLFLLILPIANMVALLGVRFHDLPNLIVIILQAIWYSSPIFFEPKLFQSANLSFLLDYNPIYHLLLLFRAPLLEGHIAPLSSYLFVIICVLFAWTFNIYFIKKEEKNIIFYI